MLRTYRQKPTETLKMLMELASRARLYVVQSFGPTSFLLTDDSDHKLRVSVGERHSCSCRSPREHDTLCQHVLFVLLRVLKVPRENPLVWQSGLIDREINEVLMGRAKLLSDSERRRAAWAQGGAELTSTEGQRPLNAEDPCPICQDDMTDEATVVFCHNGGCGNNMHRRCMVRWVAHRKTLGENPTCPLCRKEWGEDPRLRITDAQARREISERNSHQGVICRGCRATPVPGALYRCLQCRDYELCGACYGARRAGHRHREFQVKRTPRGEWEDLSEDPAQALLPEDVVRELQGRELTAEDYETLVALHTRAAEAVGGVPRSLLDTLRAAEPAGACAEDCVVCMGPVPEGQPQRVLPCGHGFHAECIDGWLLNGRNACPVDNLPVFPEDDVRAARAAQKAAEGSMAGAGAGAGAGAPRRQARARPAGESGAAAAPAPQPVSASAGLVGMGVTGVGVASGSRPSASASNARPAGNLLVAPLPRASQGHDPRAFEAENSLSSRPVGGAPTVVPPRSRVPLPLALPSSGPSSSTAAPPHDPRVFEAENSLQSRPVGSQTAPLVRPRHQQLTLSGDSQPHDPRSFEAENSLQARPVGGAAVATARPRFSLSLAPPPPSSSSSSSSLTPAYPEPHDPRAFEMENSLPARQAGRTSSVPRGRISAPVLDPQPQHDPRAFEMENSLPARPVGATRQPLPRAALSRPRSQPLSAPSLPKVEELSLGGAPVRRSSSSSGKLMKGLASRSGQLS
jgi:E3 ubiquitin-protein ligase ZSWIM2